MTLTRVWLPSPNYSTRSSAVRLVVLHTAEGATSYQSLGSYFANPSSGVSSHVGIDDTPGIVGEYVRSQHKAWTQGSANPYSVAAELCAWAEWDRAEWDRHPAMLANAAEWMAEECHWYGIPIRRLTAAEAQGGAAGVCQHVDLGAAGGGHWDCGPGFPIDDVIALAVGGGSPGPVAPDEEAGNMVLADPLTGGVWVAYRDGAVYALDGAPYCGGANNPAHNPTGAPCVGIGDNNGDGYVLVLEFPGRDLRSYHYPRDGSAAAV